MKIAGILIVLLALAGGGYIYLDKEVTKASEVHLPATSAARHIQQKQPGWIAASGIIEPFSEELDLAFELSGVIDAVPVEEGDTIQAGTTLARLRQHSYAAQLQIAHAEALVAEAEYEKLQAGARPQERDEAWAEVRQAKATMEQAEREARRREALRKADHIAPEEADRARTEYNVAREQYREALQRFQLADDPFRSEDIRKAGFSLEAAQARVREAEAELEKTVITAPISGTVLRILRRPGEAVSVLFDSPVVTMGNIATLNIRAEVDEKDIAQVALGQRAYATADTFADRQFWGKVTRISRLMGRKNILSGDPAEREDRKVMEVLITMDTPDALVSGLRMDVFIEGNNAQ